MGVTDFLNELFGDYEGYVYAPTMTNRWIPQFFEWPQQKAELLLHLKDYGKREVYISPILFTKPRVAPETFKGTQWIWTEFDGKTPPAFDLTPTIRIQSSKPGHEHWYWKLNEFTTDVDKVQDATKRLAYHLQADLSVWDYAVVLRPPDTFNHKRGCATKLVETNMGTYGLEEFLTLPDPPTGASIDLDKSKLRPLQELVAKYRWTQDAYELLTKKVPEGQRSDALSRFAFECAEMGMSNEEIFVVILDAATRWKKFEKRTDKERRLTGLIGYVRSKKAVQLELTDKSAIYRFNDFMNTEVNLEWVIPGVLPVAGSAVIFGPPEVGKSTLTLRMGMAIAAGHDKFLNWPIERKQRVAFISLEMPHDELKHFFNDMDLEDEERAKLQESFFVWPVGHAYPFDVREQQMEVLKYVDEFGIELLLIDSLAASMYGSVSDDDDIKKLNSFLNEDLRKERRCGYVFVHHPRKPGSTDIKKPVDFYDMYGSIYITANAQTVINLNPLSGDLLKCNIFKSRLALDHASFQLQRLPNRSFVIPDKKQKASILGGSIA